MLNKEIEEFLNDEPVQPKPEPVVKWNLEYHEYANLFPMISKDELKQLASDIKQKGLQEPIVLYEDKILDGRNRYEACKLVDIIPQYKHYDQEIDPLDYVISINIKRRHLDAGQKAAIASEIANMRSGERTDLEPKTNSSEVKISIETAAKMLNVGTTAVKQFKQLKEKNPEKATQVKEGKTKLNAAVKETKKEDQIKQRTEAVKDLPKDSNLHLGDCVKILGTLPENYVDCVVMDPPYLIDYTDTRESYNPTFNDSSDNKEKKLDEWFKAIKRVIKPNAHIYCFYGMDEDNTFYKMLKKYFNPQLQPIIWVKNNHTMAMQGFEKVYASMYEPIYFCSNGERMLNDRVSRNVLNYAIPTNKVHKTQKPVELLSYLINNSTIQGEIVLDPFMGSGSTCIAAKQCGRKYIGIEIESDIYNIAVERINTI